MGQNFEHEVVIVGAGPAGMCAAMYTGRAMLEYKTPSWILHNRCLAGPMKCHHAPHVHPILPNPPSAIA